MSTILDCLRYRRAAMSVLAILLLLVTLSIDSSAATSARAAEVANPTGYVPTTATQEQISAAQPAQPMLVGISKDYPPICDGVTDAKVEDTGSTTDSDRVDVGAPVIELEGLQPDTSYSYCFFVQNVGNEPLKFGVSATELVGADDPNVKQQLIRPPVSVGTWLHPVGTTFSIEPGERQYVPYTIDVPSDPPAGTSAGAIEVVRLEEGDVSGGGAGFQISMLHKVLITFPGGENKPLKISNVSAPRVLTRENGKKTYVMRLNVRNVGNMVDVHHTDLTMNGLGRTVGTAQSSDSVLLPDGAERVEVRIKNMPWIGIYHPTATVDGRAGDVEVDLPWLLVLPPWPYVVALVLAILFPIIVVLRRWLRARADWRDVDEDEEAPLGDE